MKHLDALFATEGRLGRLDFVTHLAFLVLLAWLVVWTVVMLQLSLYILLIFAPFFLWALCIIQIKRFRDRDKSGWRLLVFLLMYLPLVLGSVLSLFGLLALWNTDAEMLAVMAFGKNILYLLSPTLAQHFVEMFILPGTDQGTDDAANYDEYPGNEFLAD